MQENVYFLCGKVNKNVSFLCGKVNKNVSFCNELTIRGLAVSG